MGINRNDHKERRDESPSFAAHPLDSFFVIFAFFAVNFIQHSHSFARSTALRHPAISGAMSVDGRRGENTRSTS